MSGSRSQVPGLRSSLSNHDISRRDDAVSPKCFCDTDRIGLWLAIPRDSIRFSLLSEWEYYEVTVQRNRSCARGYRYQTSRGPRASLRQVVPMLQCRERPSRPEWPRQRCPVAALGNSATSANHTRADKGEVRCPAGSGAVACLRTTARQLAVTVA